MRSGGLLAITLKEGAGEAWTRAKVGLPRHFTYWREPAVRAAVRTTGWQILSLHHVAGRLEPWLLLIARAGCLPSDVLGPAQPASDARMSLKQDEGSMACRARRGTRARRQRLELLSCISA